MTIGRDPTAAPPRVQRFVAAAALLAAACAPAAVDYPDPPPTPAEHAAGERVFVAHCERCHGRHARGTEQGPPLVHPVYEPGHHGDAAFTLAVRQGVVRHHWRFGDMPPQPQVTPAEVAQVTAYVRWLQRAAGID